MTIYVDDAAHPYRGMMMCHMMTDGDINELHEFATRLGLRRTWFQAHVSHPHYDLSKNKRQEAIRLGAHAVSSVEMVRRCVPLFKEPN